jgi:sterol desaturase/sphingolipid hydroxylase (fatty acid hydroxylase superfamily)
VVRHRGRWQAAAAQSKESVIETLTHLWESLPEPLRDPVALAVPFFVFFVVVEALAAALLVDAEPGPAVRVAADGRAMPVPGGYARQDSRASISMGAVSVATMAFFKFIALIAYTAIYAYVAPWHLSSHAWYTWVIALVGVDFLFYWTHRIAHRVRLVWATHQAHHSSEYFNFSTALRQKWNNSAEIVMWLPLPFLGVPPWMVFFSFSVNLVYQFFVHTERVDRLWAPVELLVNTPSHHRVHHGCDPEYLDRNYAGILIIWDRMFGTFQPEIRRPTYGLTTPVGTHRILELQTREYANILADVRRSGRLGDKLGYVFGPPGWAPATTELDA